jgi:hypothetical protein
VLIFLSVTTGTGLIVDEVCQVLAALLRLQHHLVLQAGLAHPQLHPTPLLFTQQLYKNKVGGGGLGEQKIETK